MRTTLELDDDLVATAKQIARQQGTTIGQVISRLARQSLAANAPPKTRNGVRLFATSHSRNVKPDLPLVNQLRDDV